MFHQVSVPTHIGYWCKLNQHHSFYSLCQLSSSSICFYSNCKAFFMHGYFSPNIPGCFVSDYKEGFLKGDIVVLGQDTGQKVMMEEIIEVGKHFILYKVKEVVLIPMGGVRITQLVAPLNLHQSVLLHFLLLIIMAFSPCFFWSSAIFGKIDRASEEDEVQSQFSDSWSMV